MSRTVLALLLVTSAVAFAADPKPAAALAAPEVPAAPAAPAPPLDPLSVASRLRQDARANRITPAAVFARTEVSPSWKPYKSAADARATAEVDDLISVYEFEGGIRLVVNEPSSMGDNSDRVEYVYAPDGTLVQFAHLSLGWGDVCGNVREEVVVDLLSPQEARRGFAIRYNDGKPFTDAQLDANCASSTHPETAEDPGYQPSWRSFRSVPIAGAFHAAE
jgi:hypothetical protein